jgi:putative SOS response-associated peptidase YedK
MCYNIQYMEAKAKKLAERYATVMPENFEPDPNISDLSTYHFVSGFDFPLLPIIKSDGIFLFEWGLIPNWVQDEQAASAIRVSTLNARSETVFEKPSFKHSIITQKCLLPVNGFFESQDFNNEKYPHYINLKSQEVFSLACIFEIWKDLKHQQWRKTFSILTTPANPMMEKIHNVKKRMPLILKKEDESKWINPKTTKDEMLNLFKPYDETDMKSRTVSKLANSPKTNRNIPSIRSSVHYPELSSVQLTLF